MKTAPLRQLPDITGCSHSRVGIDTASPRRTGSFEIGYCLQWKNEIAFRLNGEGERTGETQIIRFEENPELRAKMQIIKTGEDRYRVEVKDRLTEEDVNDVQFLGMASERTIGMTADEIVDAFEAILVGHTITVDYESI